MIDRIYEDPDGGYIILKPSEELSAEQITEALLELGWDDYMLDKFEDEELREFYIQIWQRAK